MLETIREFATERLEASGNAENVRRKHADRMVSIAEAARLSEDDPTAFDIATGRAERDDLRAALDWTARHDVELGLRLMIALENFWVASGPSEGMLRIGDLLDRAGAIPTTLRATALRVHGGPRIWPASETRPSRSGRRAYGSTGRSGTTGESRESNIGSRFPRGGAKTGSACKS